MRKLAIHLSWILALSLAAAAQQPAQSVYQSSRDAKHTLGQQEATPAAPAARTSGGQKSMVRGNAKLKQQIQQQADVASAAVGSVPAPPRGRRDPFVSPIKLVEDSMKSSAACSTGARCLLIDQIELKGIVKTTSGMIAMVENAARKQYNLRENDPVFNGFVLKITGDSIVFRQNATDSLGHQGSKEVVKRVTVPVV